MIATAADADDDADHDDHHDHHDHDDTDPVVLRNPSCCRGTSAPSLRSSTTGRETCSSPWPRTR